MRNGINTGILLAAGRGSRMGGDKKKQFLEIGGVPLIRFGLSAMLGSAAVDEIVIVTSPEDVDYVRREFVKGDEAKAVSVIPGGSERCLSVWEGIKAALSRAGEKGFDAAESYVFIQDGARPFLTEDILQRNLKAAMETGACVTAIPAQDTLRRENVRSCGDTIPRNGVWQMQTPQTFRLDIAAKAFERLRGMSPEELKAVTDDVMVVQSFDPSIETILVMGSKTNIKVTTPEDLIIAEALFKVGGARQGVARQRDGVTVLVNEPSNPH